jgi:hypothetical protein
MHNSSTTPAVPGSNGPWRLLILDSDPEDPRWLIGTVTLPSDVRPAVMEPGGRRYADWAAVTGWVHEQVGRPVTLTPIAAICWRVDEGGPR